MVKKCVRRYNFSQPPTSPPDVIHFRGQYDEEKREYWIASKVIHDLGLSGGEEFCIAMVNIKASLHHIPWGGKDKYGQYVLKSDVDLIKVFLESNIAFHRDGLPKELPVVFHVPVGWSGHDKDWSDMKIEYAE